MTPEHIQKIENYLCRKHPNMEYKIGEFFSDRVHVVCVQNNDLIVEIDGIIYSAELSTQTIIQSPAQFVQEKYLVDYFKCMLPHTKINYEQGGFSVLFITDNNKFYLEIQLHNPKELRLLKRIQELEKQINA
jgi:hypothetical protein